MRRVDREQTRDFALQVLNDCNWVTLSMVDPEGQPYAVPITIAREGLDIYVHCAPEGHKIDCLRANPQICITAVSQAQTDEEHFTVRYASVTGRGTAKEITETEEKIHALRLLCARHTPNNLENMEAMISGALERTAVWKFTLTDISGKANRPLLPNKLQAPMPVLPGAGSHAGR